MTRSNEELPESKVARLIAEYDLDGIGAELEALWTREDDERKSLRDLATHFNRALLESALRDADIDTLDTDPDRTYERLAGEGATAGVRTETRVHLERNGLDVDALEADFVSYQAIRSYLEDWRGAEYESISDEAKLQKDLETIRRLQNRTRSVTTSRIEQLGTTGRLDISDFEVVLDVGVLCQDCGTRYSVSELFDQGGCRCGVGDPTGATEERS